MSNSNFSDGATEQTSPTLAPNAEKSGNAGNVTFTPEQTSFVQSLIKDALKQQAKNSQYASQRREQEGRQTGKPDASQTELSPLKQTVKELTEFKQKAEQKLKASAIRDAVSAAGFTGDRAELLLDHVNARYGNKVIIGDDDKPYIADGDDHVSLTDYVKAYTSKNELFKPASSVPQANIKATTGSSSHGGKFLSQLSQAELSKLSESELAAMAAAEWAADPGTRR